MTRKHSGFGVARWYLLPDIRSGPAAAGPGNLGRTTQGALLTAERSRDGVPATGQRTVRRLNGASGCFFRQGGNNLRRRHPNRRGRSRQPSFVAERPAVVGRVHDPPARLDETPHSLVVEDRRPGRSATPTGLRSGGIPPTRGLQVVRAIAAGCLTRTGAPLCEESDQREREPDREFFFLSRRALLIRRSRAR